MIYYAKDNSLYSSDTPVFDENFIQITEDEYFERLHSSMQNREQGTILVEPDGDFIQDFSGATETDYMEALESLGVDFGG